MLLALPIGIVLVTLFRQLPLSPSCVTQYRNRKKSVASMAGDNGCAHHARTRAKPGWVIETIIHLKAVLPDHGCRKLADTFNRLHAASGMTIGKTCVATIIRRHQHAIAAQRRHWRQQPPGPGAINQTWALDLTGKTDSSGHVHYLLGLLDHGSRRLLCLRALVNKTAFTVLGHLFLAIGRYGLPPCDPY